MSLKTFHLFVVLVAVGVSCAYGMWALLGFINGTGVTGLAIGAPLLAGGLALTMHGVIFYKHSENEPWL
jgi:hypothetical protein